jgi:hypothetical protein
MILLNLLLLNSIFGYNIINNDSFSVNFSDDSAKVILNINEMVDRINLNILSEDIINIQAEIFDQSTEGGIIVGFFSKKKPQKISIVLYGETGKLYENFYFNDEEKLIAKERTVYSYTAPIYSKDWSLRNRIHYYYYIVNDEVFKMIFNYDISDYEKDLYSEDIKEILDDLNRNEELLREKLDSE